MFARLLQRWEVSTSSGSHFQVLDGLRGVAILLVVAFHTLYTNPAHGVLARVAGYIIAAGWMGVPIFFVLSGFLISYPFFLKRATDPQFWYQRGYARRRLGKIIPPFYLSLVLFLGFYWWQFRDPGYVHSAWMWALGLGNFMSISPNLNGVYWSLIVESHFYILLPLLFWLTRGRTVKTTAGFIFVLLFAIPLLVRHFTWPADMTVLPDYHTELFTQVWLKLRRFPCELDYFGYGVAFAGIYVGLTKGEEKNRLEVLGLLGYVGVLLMAVTLLDQGLWVKYFDLRAYPTRWSIEFAHLMPAVSAMLMLFFVFDTRSVGARILSSGPLRFCGIVSFEWFLFHGPIVGWFHEHTGPSHGSLLAYAWRTVVPLTLTLVFSALVYRYFSLPILKRVRNSLQQS